MNKNLRRNHYLEPITDFGWTYKLLPACLSPCPVSTNDIKDQYGSEPAR